MSDDLIAFYRARLDEVEADAIAAAKATTGRRADMAWLPGPAGEEEALYVGLSDLTSEWRCHQHTEVPNMCDDRQLLKVDRDFLLGPGETRSVVSHIARHNPANVLADVEAKRALLTAYEQTRAWYMLPENMSRDAGVVQGLWDAIQHLAAAFSPHPDYREEWKP